MARPGVPGIVGYIGRLVEQKGLMLLLEAMRGMDPDVRLLLVGEGPQLPELRKRASALGIQGRTSFTPPVPHAGVPEVLRQIDVLVLPSTDTRYWSEQFGRVLIEAMACGVPVLASDSGGIPEVVGEAGILFRRGDSNELREKLQRLLGDRKEWMRRSVAGRERALNEFDVPVVAGVLERGLRKLLTKPG